MIYCAAAMQLLHSHLYLRRDVFARPLDSWYPRQTAITTDQPCLKDFRSSSVSQLGAMRVLPQNERQVCRAVTVYLASKYCIAS